MIHAIRHGQTGVVIRLKISDASQADGRGLTGLAFDTGGLTISTIADSESTPVVYRSADGTIEGIPTLGTYQAPTAGKCRFREVHATLHRGVYEIHLADSRYAAPNARTILISVRGDVNVTETDALIGLTRFDLYAANGGFDPLSAAVPGSYPAGTAGARLGWLDASVASRSTYQGGPVQAVVSPVTVGVVQDKTGYSLAAGGVDAIPVESGINLRQAIAPMLAALAGNVVRGSGDTIVIHGANTAVTRITATASSDGTRTTVGLILPP
jgi:hypothetical protein